MPSPSPFLPLFARQFLFFFSQTHLLPFTSSFSLLCVPLLKAIRGTIGTEVLIPQPQWLIQRTHQPLGLLATST